MRKLLALLLVSSTVFAQQPVGSGTDTSFAVRVSVNLVEVDAVVTDSHGRHIAGLNASDFEVSQDGIPQVTTNFSYIGGSTGRSSAGVAPEMGRAGVRPPPSVALKPEQVQRAIVLLIDDVSMTFGGIAHVREELKKFVERDMQPDDLVAVMSSGFGIGVLQHFSNDKRFLTSAIESIKLSLPARGDTSSPVLKENTLPERGGLEAAEACLRDRTTPLHSLAAAHYAIEGLRNMPGRKALVMVSAGLQVAPLPGLEAETGCSYSEVQMMLRKVEDAAQRAGVVIYTIDSRGLETLTPDASYNPFTGLSLPDRRSNSEQETLVKQFREVRQQYYWSQGGLTQLANDTGGTFAIHNDLRAAVRESADDLSGYYVLAYHPPAGTFEGPNADRTFHRISVKLKRRGLTVRTRAGFFGFKEQEDEMAGATPEQQFFHAMTSPFVKNDIPLRMTSFFSQTEKPVITTYLYLDAKDMTFTRAEDGRRKAVLDAIAASFTPLGVNTTAIQNEYTFTTDESSYQRAMTNGVVLKLQQVANGPGGYQMRVAVRDATSGKMGSANQFVTVPDLKRDRLALSGLLLRSWQAEQSATVDDRGQSVANDPGGNEAIRTFRPGDRIAWYFQVFNAHPDADQRANLKVQVRVFRDGAPVTQSEAASVSLPQDSTANRLSTSGHMTLTPEFTPGNYALQVEVTDERAKKKNATASQWIDFQVR